MIAAVAIGFAFLLVGFAVTAAWGWVPLIVGACMVGWFGAKLLLP